MDHDLAGLVDCRSRVNRLSVSEDRTSKTAGWPVPSDRTLPMHSHHPEWCGSNSESLLVLPRTRTAWGDRSFQTAAPCLWDMLPVSVKQTELLSGFKLASKPIFLLWLGKFNKHILIFRSMFSTLALPFNTVQCHEHTVHWRYTKISYYYY